MSELSDYELVTFLGHQAGVEVHISDVAFERSGPFRVFYNGTCVAEGDKVHEVLVTAIRAIARARHQAQT